ncbi:hypothetical protein AAFF_G00269140 [Aldrovandia affinis]|uniref:Uncharacterized protein n=1 Tax=Aldrovandia affinis TaxID=143900 RepID=A0AAD7SSA2_9TELE|nr:hypothetical protein AAFF_G00269140 [Aldrovandia affinis]
MKVRLDRVRGPVLVKTLPPASGTRATGPIQQPPSTGMLARPLCKAGGQATYTSACVLGCERSRDLAAEGQPLGAGTAERWHCHAAEGTSQPVTVPGHSAECRCHCTEMCS